MRVSMLGARLRAARFHDLNFYWRNAHAGYVGPGTLPGEKFAIGTSPLGPPHWDHDRFRMDHFGPESREMGGTWGNYSNISISLAYH
jgi:hypothetical protein